MALAQPRPLRSGPLLRQRRHTGRLTAALPGFRRCSVPPQRPVRGLPDHGSHEPEPWEVAMSIVEQTLTPFAPGSSPGSGEP